MNEFDYKSIEINYSSNRKQVIFYRNKKWFPEAYKMVQYSHFNRGPIQSLQYEEGREMGRQIFDKIVDENFTKLVENLKF